MSCHPNCSNHHESAGACSGQDQRRSRRDDGQAARMYATKKLHSRMYPSACSPGELPSGELTTKHLRLHTGAPSEFRGESDYKIFAGCSFKAI